MEKTETSMAEALASAHVTLLKDLRELELAGHGASKHDISALRARLEAARAHLAEHFRFEEGDGYMADVRKREPRLERVIDELAFTKGTEMYFKTPCLWSGRVR